MGASSTAAMLLTTASALLTTASAVAPGSGASHFPTFHELAMKLQGKVIVVTRALAAAGDELSIHVLDVTNRAVVQALPDAVLAHHGVIDGLIHCAGIIQPFVRLADLDYDEIDRVIQVDLYGTIHVVKALLPLHLARPEAHVANVSSMGGFLPVPGQTIHGAAKAGVLLLTEGLHAELLDTQGGSPSSFRVLWRPASQRTRV